MEHYSIVRKTDFDAFIAALARQRTVVAPVAKDCNNYAFERVRRGDEIALSHMPTILPPKKFFMPPQEKIQEFNIGEHRWSPVMEYEDLIIFGVHTCDLAGIQCLNMVFSTDPKDGNYITRKHNIAIIGLECVTYCDEHASCAVMDTHLPNGGYDLFFTDIGDRFIVHVNSEQGEALLKQASVALPATEHDAQALAAVRNQKRLAFKDEVSVAHPELKKVFSESFASPIWNELGQRCVACGNCTNVCPTCYCFDIRDDLNLDLGSGARWRIWDSCQNEDFAKVAGGENFREERAVRQRHRYMRKFNYPVERYRRYFCVGCGRCTRACMAKINLKETINDLAEERI